MKLEPIAENVWGVQSSVRLMAAVYFPIRATVIRRKNGEILIYSPIDFDDKTAEAIRQLGRVTQLFSPVLFHYKYLNHCRRLFPEAQVLGVPGHGEKAPDVEFDAWVEGEGPPEWKDDFSVFPYDGVPTANEVALLHRESRTLLVADLIFNIHRVPKGWLTSSVLRMSGAWKLTAQSRLYRSLHKNPRAARASRDSILEADFDRLVMCHGELIEGGAKGVFRRALSWLDE